MNRPTAPTMQAVPSPYTPQNFGAGYNPWGGSSGTGVDQSQGSSDPYASQISSMENQGVGYANQYTQQMPGMQNNLNQSMQGAQQFQNSTSQYPSYPNMAGAGSQSAGGMGIAQPKISPMGGSGEAGAGSDGSTTNTSNGFNPWSLQGEAMTRKN